MNIKKMLSCILLTAFIVSCIPMVYAAGEVDKNVVIDTSVPLFKDLKDGEIYTAEKDISIADLSKVDCLILKKGTGKVEFKGRTFNGYTELKRESGLECIDYTKVYTLSESGSYLVYAIDEYDHGTVLEFTLDISAPTPTPTPRRSSGGGGGGGSSSAIEPPHIKDSTDANAKGGTVTAGEPFVLEADTNTQKIYYTTDGTKPTAASTLYDGSPITLTEGQTLKAITVSGSKQSSAVEWKAVAPTATPTPAPTPTAEPTPEPPKKGGNSLVRDTLEAEEHMAYLNGYPYNLFKPDIGMTRAEVAVMFARLMKDKIDVNTVYPLSFPDVDRDIWYANYIGFMEQRGIVIGYSEDGSFRPENVITRAEFAAMASRFMEYDGGYECDFADMSNDYWAYGYIAFGTHNGWINGYDEDNTFRPDNIITRAEATAMVNRMLARQADRDYIDAHESELAVFSDVTREHWAYYNIIEATNAHDYQMSSDNREEWR